MIDIHSHILPGVDDGSESIRMTLDMLSNAVKDGTKEIIATPHFCRGYAEVEYEKIIELSKSINELAQNEGIDIKIYQGQEIFYSENIVEDYKNKTIGTLNDSKYLLLELPLHGHFNRQVLDEIYELQVMGLHPILAHPERYKFFKEKPSLINDFINEDILFQVNAGSLEGDFGKEAQKTAEIFLKNKIYNFIGSDAHNNKGRKTGVKNGTLLAASKEKIYSNLFEDSAKKMLRNEEINFYGDKLSEKRWFRFFK